MEDPVTTSNGKEIPVELLQDLMAGRQPFLSWSVCKLKVTQGKDVKFLEVPIKSMGMADVLEKITKLAPTPPRRKEVIKQGSREGRDLKLSNDIVSWYDDIEDPTYQEQLKVYELNSTWKVVLYGLAINIVDENGSYLVKANDVKTATEVLDESKAIIVLKQSGLTGDHLQTLAKDIRELTKYEEERIDQESGKP